MANRSTGTLNKEQRYQQMNENRKLRREQLIMERRGLNFLTDAQASHLEDAEAVEQEVDNIAPKVVAILGLNAHCDCGLVREQLIEQCQSFEAGQKQDEEMKEDGRLVWLAPNPGASTLGNKKHRMQFLLLDPAD